MHGIRRGNLRLTKKFINEEYAMTTILMLSLAILGICVTYYFGAKALKTSRRMRIAFYEEDCISLFESIVQGIEGLEVNFEKKPVSRNLVLLKGCVANVGGMDIDKGAIHKPLTFSLPEVFKWLKAKIVSSSPEVNASYHLSSPNELVFEWDLLKPNEYFRFDALVETPMTQGNNNRRAAPVEALRSNLSLAHRITNLASVETGTLRRRQRPSSDDIAAFIGIFLIGFVFVFFSITGGRDIESLYHLKLNNGQTLEVFQKKIEGGRVILKQVDGPFQETLDQDTLKTKYHMTYSRTRMIRRVGTMSYVLMFVGGLMSVIGFGSLWMFIREARNERKRLRMVKLLK
jgi:hypothetical protein